MTEDFNAGRLYVDAYVDTKGATRGLQRHLDAQTKEIRAKIRAEIDTRGTVAAARRSATEASAAARVKLKAELDTRGLIKATREAAAKASAAARVKIAAEVDRASAAAVKSQIADLGRGVKAKVDVEADTAGANAEIEATRATQQARPITIPVHVKLNQVGSAIAQISKLPMLVGGIYSLATALTSVGGGLVSITAGASQAVSTLAVLPNLIGVLGQSIGVLLGGLSGIGEAVKQMGAVKDAQAATAAPAAVASNAGQAASRRAQQASQQRAQAQAIRAAEQGVADARRAVTRATIAARDAQQDLNRARVEAREELRDLRDELQEVRNNEQEAVDAVTEAKMRLQDVEWNAAASPQERAEAEAAMRAANNDLEEARARRKDIEDDAGREFKKGVEGNDAVVDAQRRLRDARMQVADANRGVARAEQALAQAQRRESIPAATAAAAGVAGLTTANLALTNAMDNLSPAGQRFARFVYDTLMPRMKQMKFAIQEALLPPLQRGIELALPLLDTLQVGLVGTADRIGVLAIRIGRLFGSQNFNTDVGAIMASNNRALGSFGRAMFNVIDIMRDLAVVAGPVLLEPFARWVATLTRGWRQSVKAGRASGDLADFLGRAGDRAAQLGDIVSNLAGTLFAMGGAAIRGNDVLSSFEKTTQRWQDWAESDSGQEKMEKFFVAIKPVNEALAGLIGSLIEFFVKATEGGGGPLVVLLDSLTAIVDALTMLLDVPGVGPALGALMAVAGVGGALGVVAGGVLRLAGSFAKIGKVTGLTKLAKRLRSTGGEADGLAKRGGKAMKRLGGSIVSGTKRGTAGLVKFAKRGGKALLDVGTAAGKNAAAGLRRAAGAARSMGAAALTSARKGLAVLWSRLVLAGRAALIAAGNFLRLAVGQARAAAAALLHNARLVAQRAIMLLVAGATKAWAIAQRLLNLAMRANPIGVIITLLIALGAFLVLMYKRHEGFRKVVNKVWAAIKRGVEVAWKKGIKPAFDALVKGLKTLGGWMTWLWDKAVEPTWNFIRKAVEIAWTRIYKPYLKKIWDGLQTLGRWFKWLWDKGVKPAWNSIKDAIKTGWEKGIKPIFNTLANFITKHVKPAFRTGVDAIKKIWKGLENAAKTPVRFVVNTVAAGLVRALNKIPSVNLPIPSVGFKSGGVMPGYTPGRDVHDFVSRTAGRLRLSGGEAIMRPEWTRQMGGPKAIDAMNAAARRGKAILGAARAKSTSRLAPGANYGKFATGGVWHPGPRSTRADHGKSLDQAWDINSATGTGTPVRAFLKGVITTVANTGSTSYGQYIKMNHPEAGLQSLYAHLSAQLVRVGQSVARGQVIGREGNTGGSTGPHLHFELGGGQSALAGAVASGSTGGVGLGAGFGTVMVKKPWSIPNPLAAMDPRAWVARLRGMGGFGAALAGLPGHLSGKAKAWGRDKLEAAYDHIKGLGGWAKDTLSGYTMKAVQARGIGSSVFGAGAGLAASTGGMGVRKAVQTVASRYGWGGGAQWNALSALINAESSWNPAAANPTSSARGLFQKMTSIHGPVEKTPGGQAVWGLNYIRGRYGSPVGAWGFHQRNNWYDRGGSLYPGSTYAHNGTGKVETVFTNENIVAMTDNLARIARSLVGDSTIIDSRRGGALVENLDITTTAAELPGVLRDVDARLRYIRNGGVHADRLAQAPV